LVGLYHSTAWALSASTNALNIGGRYWGSYGFQIDALIDEVRVSNIARNIADMHTSRTDNAYMLDNHTILLMHLDDKNNKPSYLTATGLNGTTGGDNFDSTDYSTDTELVFPIELNTFTAIANGNSIILNWQTATERNNYGFEIQRRKDGNKEWAKIGFVEGAGNSNSPRTYSFTDKVNTNGKYSYRLKQIDLDGSYEYSNVVEINIGVADKFELLPNYPNPFNPTTKIKYAIPTEMHVTLNVYDVLGRKVATLVNKKQNAGNYEVVFNAGNLPSGIYFAKITAGTYSAVRKMMLVK
jgi:hypothetical protein